MKINRILLYTLVALVVIGLSACVRSASTPPAETATQEGEFPLPGTEEAMDMLEQFATQTAVALSGELEQPTETSPPPEEEEQPTATPQPEAEQPEETEEPEEAEPPPATEAPEPAATFEVPKSYALKEGEHPYCIARRFNVNQYELLDQNGLTLNSRPVVGFELDIPQTGNTFSGQRALRSHPTDHTVQAGDTIYSIACLYGDVHPLAIAEANGLDSPYTLAAGTSIKIP
jgi:LysM repeat protein